MENLVDDPPISEYNPMYNQILRLRPMTNTLPVASITYVSNTLDSLVVTGEGQPSIAAGSILTYRWTSSKNGVLPGTAATLALPTTELIAGSHVITLEVQDNTGAWSPPVTTCCVQGKNEPVHRVYVPNPSKSRWTMLLYLDADYADRGALKQNFDRTLNQLRQNFPNPDVCVAALLDGPESIGNGRNDTRRLLLAKNIPSIDELHPDGEQYMDDPATLAQFVQWGQTLCPADHYYLAIADHGQALEGIAWDATSAGKDSLSVSEIVAALNQPDIAPIDILHLDACSMNLIDVAHELRNSAKYLIASQYLGWSYFAYDTYLETITQTTSPEALAGQVVDIYAHKAKGRPFTLTALNLARIEPVKNGVDDLAVLLKAWVQNNPAELANRREILKTIRRQSQRFNSNADLIIAEDDVYVDLLDWVTRIYSNTATFGSAIGEAAGQLKMELKGTLGIEPVILRNRAASNVLASAYLPKAIGAQNPRGVQINLDHANGLSIYYPIASTTPPTITQAATLQAEPLFDIIYDNYVNERSFDFTLVSRWDEFLRVSIGVPEIGQPLAASPGPLAMLDLTPFELFLPIITR